MEWLRLFLGLGDIPLEIFTFIVLAAYASIGITVGIATCWLLNGKDYDDAIIGFCAGLFWPIAALPLVLFGTVSCIRWLLGFK